MVIAFWLRPIPSDEELWVYDRNTSTLEPIFVNSDEERATVSGGYSQNPSEARLSANGRFVVFSADVDNFDPEDTNNRYDLYIRDRQLGTTTRIGLPNGGGQPDGNNGRWGKPPMLSADGTKVVFFSDAENLTLSDQQDDQDPYGYDYADVFYLDIPSGLIRRMSEVPGSFVGGDGSSQNPAISPDGSMAAFFTTSENFGTPPARSQTNVMLYDPATGSLTHVNKPISGEPEYDTTLGNTQMDFNYDGSILYFASRQDNLVEGDAPDLVPDPFDPNRPPLLVPSLDLFAFKDGSLSIINPSVNGEDLAGRWPSTNDQGDVLAFAAAVEENNTSTTSVAIMKRGDILGPNILAFQRVPDGDVGQGVLMDIIGLASDINRGNTDIASAEFRIDEGEWMPLPAKDGTFDNELEELRGFLDTATLEIGAHIICARASDASGQVGPETCDEVNVVEFPDAEDFNLFCTHSPLWPQAGDEVNIATSAVNMHPFDASMTWAPVERTEVWFNDNTAPVDVHDFYGTSSVVYKTEPLEEGEFYYGCRIILGSKAIFSGWRKVVVGSPDPNAAIPVIYTGPSSDRIDIVFVADKDTYSGLDDPDFITHIKDIIEKGFYRYPFYNKFQHLFNFWIARTTGSVDRDSNAGDSDKEIVKPSDWEENYAFADAGAIIHQDSFRDFARNGMFSFQPGQFRTLRHEAGHRPFGLSDEYCCDSKYFQSEIFPNVYLSSNSCEEDAPNLGREASQCRSWTSDLNEEDYFSSEPDADDLMKNNTTPNAADIRKVEWKFSQCLAGLC